MAVISWHLQEVPLKMETRQVYGVVFDAQGRTLLKIELKNNKNVYSLAGGTPEKFDNTRIDTLKREFVEEVNTSLKDEIYYVGYQEVDEEDGSPVYAQVRMTAMIDNIGEKLPDPDNGKTYDRVLVSPKKAIELLGWGEIGKQIIEEASKIAVEKFNLTLSTDEEEFFV